MADNLITAEIGTIGDPAVVHGDNVGTTFRRDLPNFSVYVGRVVCNVNDECSCRKTIAVQRERYVDTLHRQTPAHRVGQKANCGAFAPGDQISNLGIGVREIRCVNKFGPSRCGADARHSITGVGTHVHHQRHGPSCYIVEFAFKTDGPTLFLLGDEIAGHWHVGIQKRTHESLGGLRHVDHVTARRIVFATSLKVSIGNANRYALLYQLPSQFVGARLIGLLWDDVDAYVVGTALRNSRHLVFVKILQKLLAVICDGFCRPERGNEMIAHRLCIAEFVAVVLTQYQSFDAGLLVGHSNTAKILRPGGSIAGVEIVVFEP